MRDEKRNKKGAQYCNRKTKRKRMRDGWKRREKENVK